MSRRTIRHIHASNHEWVKVHRSKPTPASSSPDSGGGCVFGAFLIIGLLALVVYNLGTILSLLLMLGMILVQGVLGLAFLYLTGLILVLAWKKGRKQSQGSREFRTFQKKIRCANRGVKQALLNKVQVMEKVQGMPEEDIQVAMTAAEDRYRKAVHDFETERTQLLSEISRNMQTLTDQKRDILQQAHGCRTSRLRKRVDGLNRQLMTAQNLSDRIRSMRPGEDNCLKTDAD